MNIKFPFCVVVALVFMFCSCDTTTNEIGVSLTDDIDDVEVSSSVFYASSRSVAVNSVVSRSLIGYLGRVKDPETGAYVTGDFMTQFNCIEGYHMVAIDSVASRDANNEVLADSCEIRLFYTNYYGDSLATMKLTLYELDHPMTEDVSYYSDFDPLKSGYVRADGIHKSHAYSLVNTSELAIRETTTDYANSICVRLNDPYTGKDGKTYNNYGTYLLRTYYSHPEYFANSFVFSKNLVPGFFFKMTGGVGSMAYILSPQINIFYRSHLKSKNGGDSIAVRRTLFNGTEEVLQTTTVTNDASTINELVQDNSCTYVKSPSGIFTEITLPVEEMMRQHENDSINIAKIILNRYNDREYSVYNLPSPSTLLMLESDSVTSFFEKGKVANYKRSFLASFSSSSNNYTFNNIGNLINAMWTARKLGEALDPSWTSKHPNWNKVLLVPVSTSYTTNSSYYSSSSILTNVTNDMSLTSTRLVGGTTPLSISVIYSKFK